MTKTILTAFDGYKIVYHSDYKTDRFAILGPGRDRYGYPSERTITRKASIHEAVAYVAQLVAEHVNRLNW